MDENLNNISTLKEMILDEEKLVTYVSVSKELCVHVNVSKFLLAQVVDELKKTSQDVEFNVNYIISGLTDENKARTTVCSEVELDIMRKTYKILFFEHIYSVSKGVPSVDSAIFLAVNNFNDLTLCTGLIKSNQCVKRTSEEIESLITNNEQFSATEQKLIPPEKKIKKDIKDNVTDGHGVVKIDEKPETAVKTEIPSPKKDLGNVKQKNGAKIQKGIAGFFNKPSTKSIKSTKENNRNDNKSVTTVEKLDTIAVKRTKTQAAKDCMHTEKQRAIGGVKENKTETVKEYMDVDNVTIKHTPMRNESKKQCSFPNNNHINVIKVEKQETNAVKEKRAEASKEDYMDVDNVLIKHAEVKNEYKKKNASSSNKTGNKCLNEIKKMAKIDKKRKRVLHISDSESDDENNDRFIVEEGFRNDSEDEIPPSPAVTTVKITSGILNPKKRRKIIDKTYTDEDGFILTKKEEIYESCSENEDIDGKNIKETHNDNKDNFRDIHIKTELSIKEKKNGKSKKKTSPLQKGKQATLTSFFKKT